MEFGWLIHSSWISLKTCFCLNSDSEFPLKVLLYQTFSLPNYCKNIMNLVSNDFRKLRRYVTDKMKNFLNSQLYLKKGYSSIFFLTSWVFNRDLFVEFVLNPSLYYRCETNKDCLLSQNLFVSRPLVDKSSYNLAVALLNNRRSEIRINFIVSAYKHIVTTCTN